jgi:hypothetical protein
VKLREEEKPYGARHWARVWGVSHPTSLKLLRALHRQYGSNVVWYARPNRQRAHLIASEASLQVVRVVRAERNVILVVPGEVRSSEPLGRVRGAGDEEYVPQEQFVAALDEVWRALRRLGAQGHQGGTRGIG